MTMHGMVGIPIKAGRVPRRDCAKASQVGLSSFASVDLAVPRPKDGRAGLTRL